MKTRFRKRRLRRPMILCFLAIVTLTIALHRTQDEPNLQWLPAGNYHVRSIEDGVHLRLGHHNKSARVRLMGIEVPAHWSMTHRRKGAERLRQLVSDRFVHLRLDRRRIDDDGTLLGYLFVGDLFINAQLVREGLAIVNARAEDCPAIVRRLRRAQAESKSSGLKGDRPRKPLVAGAACI